MKVGRCHPSELVALCIDGEEHDIGVIESASFDRGISHELIHSWERLGPAGAVVSESPEVTLELTFVGAEAKELAILLFGGSPDEERSYRFVVDGESCDDPDPEPVGYGGGPYGGSTTESNNYLDYVDEFSPSAGDETPPSDEDVWFDGLSDD